MQVTTVGLDIAKNLFQVHGADAQGRPVLKRKLARVVPPTTGRASWPSSATPSG
jgi:transposase